MAITLTHAGLTLQLSDRLDWTDEFSWSPVQQSKDYALGGELIVGVALKQAGRPITLESEATKAWITRADCDTLRAWAALPDIELDLVLRGVTRAVMFDHERGGFTARPVWVLLDGEVYSQQLYLPTLRFFEV